MKYEDIINWILRVFILVLLFIAIEENKFVPAMGALLAFIITLLPFYLERKFDIQFPWIVEALVAIALFLHMGGVIFDWYNQFWYWDVGLHFFGTALIALLGFMWVFSLHYTKRVRMTLKLIGLFTFMFAVAIGGMWEIFEFASDNWLNTVSQPSNTDTMGDLIIDVIGAAVISFLGMWYVKTSPEEKIRRLIINRRL